MIATRKLYRRYLGPLWWDKRSGRHHYLFDALLYVNYRRSHKVHDLEKQVMSDTKILWRKMACLQHIPSEKWCTKDSCLNTTWARTGSPKLETMIYGSSTGQFLILHLAERVWAWYIWRWWRGDTVNPSTTIRKIEKLRETQQRQQLLWHELEGKPEQITKICVSSIAQE